jgi:hypothetical protein
MGLIGRIPKLVQNAILKINWEVYSEISLSGIVYIQFLVVYYLK